MEIVIVNHSRTIIDKVNKLTLSGKNASNRYQIGIFAYKVLEIKEVRSKNVLFRKKFYRKLINGGALISSGGRKQMKIQ